MGLKDNLAQVKQRSSIRVYRVQSLEFTNNIAVAPTPFPPSRRHTPLTTVYS